MPHIADSYNQIAETFCNRTVCVDKRADRDRFSRYLKAGSTILDAGCGSGRDTKAFLEEGFAVEAIDGSEKIVEFASEHIGRPVSHLYFEEMDFQECFDGIWARSSLVHYEFSELKNIFPRFIRAIKPQGYWYFSLKYGSGVEMNRGVPFYLHSEESLKLFLSQFSELNLKEMWVSSSKMGEKATPADWIQCIVQRSA